MTYSCSCVWLSMNQISRTKTLLFIFKCVSQVNMKTPLMLLNLKVHYNFTKAHISPYHKPRESNKHIHLSCTVHALSISEKNHPSLRSCVTFCKMLQNHLHLGPISSICNLRMYHFVKTRGLFKMASLL